jgi:hypothetical protein
MLSPVQLNTRIHVTLRFIDCWLCRRTCCHVSNLASNAGTSGGPLLLTMLCVVLQV